VNGGDTAAGAGRLLEPDAEARIARYENWTHEWASVRLLDVIFEETGDTLRMAGLTVDGDGDDFACIRELIDPPKKELEECLRNGNLRARWSEHIRGRPVEKAWLYEVVSNWRSGIDVDKFDYFRRDALFLGIHKQFDHNRYMKAVRVILDDKRVDRGVLTISPPDKEKDSIRENMLELRKSLHRTAYQHKTVKKLEMHMVDILKMMDSHVRITGVDGRQFKMSEAAVELDPVAYPKLTDAIVESRLPMHEDPTLDLAAKEYERRIVRRDLMRLVADWDVDRSTSDLVSLPPSEILSGVLKAYATHAASLGPSEPVVPVPAGELRCEVCSFHYGMRTKDPISRVLFHSSKSVSRTSYLCDDDAKPMKQKVFVFWNPSSRPSGRPAYELTLSRLTLAFKHWAGEKAMLVNERCDVPQSHSEDISQSSLPLVDGGTKSGRELQIQVPTKQSTRERDAAAAPGRAAVAPRPRRALKIQASCPPDPYMVDRLVSGLADRDATSER